MGLAFDDKADETQPAAFDLVQYQTPIRSQGSRGTCTIFATAALMESLYVREGTIAMPDFSEQYLQWSVKSEVRAFTTGDGSNPQRNLEAALRNGIGFAPGHIFSPDHRFSDCLRINCGHAAADVLPALRRLGALAHELTRSIA